jgi:hypothetical protein
VNYTLSRDWQSVPREPSVYVYQRLFGKAA